MPDSTQTAIRVGDSILHSEALEDGIEGIILGAAIGLVIGALLVAAEVMTGGLAIFAIALLVGGMGGQIGKDWGKGTTHPKGKVLTGSPNVFVGGLDKPAARAKADVAHCDDHSDSEPAINQPAILGKLIAQGSKTVLINGFHAARQGDKGTCEFTLDKGCETVLIGGPTETVLEITSETSSIDGLIMGMMIVGGAILAAPVIAGIIAESAALSFWGIAGQLAARLGPTLIMGMGLGKGFGLGAGYVAGKVYGEGSREQRVAKDLGEDIGPLFGAIKIPGFGESAYGLVDSIPALFGFRSTAASAAAGAGGIAADASTGAAADASTGAAADGSTTQRYGGTGANPDFVSDEVSQARANAAYDQIRANPDDVAQIAQNTGHPPETIQTVKDHLFNSQHDILDPNTGEVSQGNFTPDEGIANLWNKAADGSLGQPRMTSWGTPIEGSANPAEITQFKQLTAHEYVESQMVKDGFPYQARGSWTENPEGGWDYNPNPNNFGAHELSPNFTENPYSHYGKITGMSPEGIPRPNADNSNLDEVVAGIRRTVAENGGAPGGRGPGGGMGTGAEAGAPGSSARSRGLPEEEPSTPARPIPANAPEGAAAAPPAEAAAAAVPEAAPAAAESAASLPKTEPADALGTPEPAPTVTTPKTYPKRTAESNDAAILVRDTINKGLEDKTLPRPGLWKGKHPTIGVTTYRNGTVDIALSGGHGNVNTSAENLQALLPKDTVSTVDATGAPKEVLKYRVIKVDENTGVTGPEFPGYQKSANKSFTSDEVWCAEPKLSAAAKVYQSSGASNTEVTGQTIFWRGAGANGYPVPEGEWYAPGDNVLDIMKPCASCRKNEEPYMDGINIGSDGLGSDN